MLTIISRIFYYGFKNFIRNGLLSTAMIAVVTLSTLVFTGLIVANVATSNMITFLKDKIDISVYFKTTTTEDSILKLKSALDELPEVKSVEYISTDRAMEIFKEQHKDDPNITQSLNELNANPFQASINIKAHNPEEYASISNYLQADELKGYIDNVSYAKNQVVIDRLTKLINGVNRGGLILTILLSIIAGLVVFNTVRLAIYSNRDEIGVMRLVGASNVFVRGPYLIEGVITGLFSALLCTALLLLITSSLPALFSASSKMDAALPGFAFSEYIYGNIFKLFLYQLAFGVGVSIFSSFIAVRRYLRS